MARPQHLRRGRYRMTPARRAALKKAQIAAANKKRRFHKTKKVGRRAAQVAAGLGGAFVTARVNSYILRPSAAKNDYHYVKGVITKKKKATQAPEKPKVLKNARMTWVPR